MGLVCFLRSTYQKASASAAIKPPDLWIHHDQMELKHLDTKLHASASKISAGSVDGGLMSSSLALAGPGAGGAGAGTGAAGAGAGGLLSRDCEPASLDRRHVPTYVDYITYCALILRLYLFVIEHSITFHSLSQKS
ncbi:hypothetical protein ACJJTC_010299 [Scirpophaga incertulas]